MGQQQRLQVRERAQAHQGAAEQMANPCPGSVLIGNKAQSSEWKRTEDPLQFPVHSYRLNSERQRLAPRRLLTLTGGPLPNFRHSSASPLMTSLLRTSPGPFHRGSSLNHTCPPVSIVAVIQLKTPVDHTASWLLC